MTKVLTAGEFIRITRTDEGYAHELGDQTGLVGTVVSGANSGGAYVNFPHTGEQQFYYLSNEFDRINPPATVPVFVVGDRAELIERYQGIPAGTLATVTAVSGSHQSKDGGLVTIRPDDEKFREVTAFARRLKHTESPAPITFKVGDWVKVQGYCSPTSGSGWEGKVGQVTDVDHSTNTVVADFVGKGRGGFDSKHLVHTEAPAPTFKTGDWVMVVNNTTWDGTVGRVIANDYNTTIGHQLIQRYLENGKKSVRLQFNPSQLEKIEEPLPVVDFKEGDWVKVVDYHSTWDGTVAQVRTLSSRSATVVNESHKTFGLRFPLWALEKTTTPKEEHWVYAKPVNTTAKLMHSIDSIDSIKYDRLVVKVSEDAWLHLYQHDNGVVTASALRNNEATYTLLSSRNPVFIQP